MTKRVTATEARRNWFRLLDEVAAGEEVVIERYGWRIWRAGTTVRLRTVLEPSRPRGEVWGPSVDTPSCRFDLSRLDP